MRWMILCIAWAGCAETIEPGHRGLLFDPRNHGLQHEVLGPGRHHVGLWGRIEDYDVTYSQHKEEVRTISSEGLSLDVKIGISFRPIVSELYDLDVEIGPNYYDEVVGPEFRTATRGVFARHSYTDVQKMNEKLEDEIEAEMRRRIAGKHIEVSSVTMEDVQYAPEIANAIRAKLVGEQEEIRRRTLQAAEQDRERLQTDAELRRKEKERKLAEEQAIIDKVQVESEAASKLTRAKADAEVMHVTAAAKAEEHRAEAVAMTPLTVMMHAYDALAKLGGSGTTVLLGDWSHVPSFLFPAAGPFQKLWPSAASTPPAPSGNRHASLTN